MFVRIMEIQISRSRQSAEQCSGRAGRPRTPADTEQVEKNAAAPSAFINNSSHSKRYHKFLQTARRQKQRS